MSDGHVAVIFTNRRADGATPGDGYGPTAERMVELAREQPGFLGVDSVRGADGVGITVSYWESREAIAAWRAHPEHLEAQRRGRDEWYAWFTTRTCDVPGPYRPSGG